MQQQPTANCEMGNFYAVARSGDIERLLRDVKDGMRTVSVLRCCQCRLRTYRSRLPETKLWEHSSGCIIFISGVEKVFKVSSDDDVTSGMEDASV